MTTEDIYNRMTGAYISDDNIKAKYGLIEGKTFNEQFSIVSVERIVFFTISVVMAFVFKAFDKLNIDVEKLLREKKAHSPNWYASMAKLFQYGYDLIPDTDTYDNSNLTDEKIEQSRIVKFAAARSKKNKSILYLKVATGSNEAKQPLSANQLAAFKSYIQLIQDGGVNIQIINDPADEMYIEMDVYFNPLILDRYGKRLDGSSDTPVQDAIKYYVHNLQFNGMYINAQLVDAVQNVYGVEFPELKRVASRYGAYADFSDIDGKEVANSGYYIVKDENLKLNFIAYEG